MARPRPARRPQPAFRPRFELLEDRALPSGGVFYWNDIAVQAQQNDIAVGRTPDQGGPTRASRAMAIVQAAVFDAANSIDRSFTSYKVQVTPAAGASLDAAVAQAAHDTLAALYPKQKSFFDSVLVQDLATIAVGPATAGAAVGATVASQILALRANDGSTNNAPYTPGTGPTDWQSDPLHPGQKGLTPNWGSVTPFTADAGALARAGAPPAPGSAEYATAYDEVFRLGGDGVGTPTERTADQTEIGIYWGYDGQPGLGTPVVLYNQIATHIAQQQHTSDIDTARLLALVNLSMADAGCSAWDTKYIYNVARPVTAIRAGDLDGNPATAGDPTWAPLGAPADNGSGTNFTPPFPAYVSGHSTFGSALFETLRDFYGRDDIAFTFVSQEYDGITTDQTGAVRPLKARSFTSFSQAEEENGQSRIYLGVHWAFDKTGGRDAGRAIADNAVATLLTPVAKFHWYAVGADEGGGPRVQVIDADTQKAVFDFFAFAPNFKGGVRVATADVTGDGVPDIIAAAGPGGGSHVKVFDGTDLHVVRSFFAYGADFSGGVYVAAADVDGDGTAEIVTGAGEGGGPHVLAFSGKTGEVVRSYFALDPAFRGGVRVAAGDMDGDGMADMAAAAGDGGGPRVTVVSGATSHTLMDFFAYAPTFTGGVYVSLGDCDGDGKADVITGTGDGGGPNVKVFDATGKTILSYYAFAPSTQPTTHGVRVASLDVNGDGLDDVLTAAGPGDAPVVECRTAEGLTDLQRLFAFDPAFTGGVNI